ncbi:hypothetical protein Salat_0656300, partial [Sesamum alatum]
MESGLVREWGGPSQAAQVWEKQRAGVGLIETERIDHESREEVLGGGEGCARVGINSGDESLGDTEGRDCSSGKFASEKLVNEEGDYSVLRTAENDGVLLEVRGPVQGETQVHTNGLLSSPLAEGPNETGHELSIIQMGSVGNVENVGAEGGRSMDRELVAVP